MSDHRAHPDQKTEEFLVSKPGATPAQATSRLNEMKSAVANMDGVDVVKTIGHDDTVNVVVISSTPATLQQVAVRFPDLIIEKNQPLEMFGPTP